MKRSGFNFDRDRTGADQLKFAKKTVKKSLKNLIMPKTANYAPRWRSGSLKKNLG
ncbi:hypothetical protein BFG60_1765 [Microcystis aeruginosa NIES-98]|nr:hypothetical protein BFG60_1765 [Microcystis aeruginosa NIES-98]